MADFFHDSQEIHIPCGTHDPVQRQEQPGGRTSIFEWKHAAA